MRRSRAQDKHSDLVTEPPSLCDPINASSFRKAATLFAVALFKRTSRRRHGSVLYLAGGICVKYDDRVSLSEAATLDFIREHTSIPVPKVHCAFERRGITYIVMQTVKGHKLAQGWADRSEASRSRLLAQLKGMIHEMRELHSPHGLAVANVHGGSLYDPRLPGLGVKYPQPTASRFGPFEDIAAFHRWLRRPAAEADKDYWPAEVNELIALHQGRDWGRPIFTHGDLSSLNILVRGDSIVGIVDWECAGWLPCYWEYTTASQVNFRNPFWANHIDSFLEPRPADLEMERIRMRFFGDTT